MQPSTARRGPSGRKRRPQRRPHALARACRSAQLPVVRPSGGLLAKYLLKLYVTGSSPRAARAIANLRRICEDALEGEYELEIVDVLEEPQRAEDDRVLATPTLIKQLPPPLRRVIGDLSDKEKVLLGLEVRREPSPPQPPSDDR